MGEIDDDPKLIHPLDRLAAERCQPSVDLAGMAAAVVAVFAKGQRQTAQAKIEESVEQTQVVAERLGILQSEQHADFAAMLRTIEIGGAAQNVSMRMATDSRFDRLEIFDALERIIPGKIASAADHTDALLAQLIDKSRRQIFRPRRAETIDDG